MLWVYDNAIAADLSASIDTSSEAENIVKVMDSQGIIDIVAQMRDDRVKFPLVCLVRSSDTPIDTSRWNYTRAHFGVPAAYDADKNTVYMEKSLPIQLSYELHVLALNTIDRDEIVRELLFKYNSMYWLSVDLPYESERKLRIGICIDPNSAARSTSSAFEYLTSGTLYETVITLQCHGAVLLSYDGKHCQRLTTDLPHIE